MLEPSNPTLEGYKRLADSVSISHESLWILMNADQTRGDNRRTTNERITILTKYGVGCALEALNGHPELFVVKCYAEVLQIYLPI